MNYKVCILAAGIGTHMGNLSEYINKALLPVKFKPVISYIIEKFPKDVEIVIAVGHQKETITDYLAVAYPERTFTFVEVDHYLGPGTGAGYSLLKCKQYLQCPFIFFAADTLVLEEIPIPDKDWFGIAPVEETEPYCTVKIKHDLICQIDDKIKTNNPFAFIGLAGIHDYKAFFSGCELDKQFLGNDIRISNGFKKLMEKTLAPIEFTWFDTGTLENYLETNKNFSGEDEDEAFNFSKGEEFLYFVNDRVIKFFADKTIVDHRYERGTTSLKGLCPKLEKKQGNFYCYKKIDGQTLYNVLNVPLLNDFLQWLKLNLWQEIKLDKKETMRFR